MADMNLFLMRHAEAEQKIDILDKNRNLTAKGIKQAQEAANYLSQHQIDVCIVSGATRTRQTASYIKNCKKLVIDHDLYNANENYILNLIAQQPSGNILIIAHNPSIYLLSLYLSSRQKDTYILEETGMPTARIIMFNFDKINSWQKLVQLHPTDLSINLINIFTPSY